MQQAQERGGPARRGSAASYSGLGGLRCGARALSQEFVEGTGVDVPEAAKLAAGHLALPTQARDVVPDIAMLPSDIAGGKQADAVDVNLRGCSGERGRVHCMKYTVSRAADASTMLKTRAMSDGRSGGDGGGHAERTNSHREWTGAIVELAKVNFTRKLTETWRSRERSSK